VQLAAYTCGIVLLLNIWGAERYGIVVDREEEMESVTQCMNLLGECEEQYVVVAVATVVSAGFAH
jgi:hypothetical protein